MLYYSLILYTKRNTAVNTLKSLLIISLMNSIALFGDTVYFNNGAVLKGVISEQNTNTITIMVDGINTTYGMRDISRIENSHVSPPPPPPPVSSQESQTPSFIPAGTMLHLITAETISTRSHASGSQFKMLLESDLYVGTTLITKRGSEVYGVVTSSKQAGRLVGQSSIEVTLRALVINGKRTPVQTQTLNILTQHNQVRNTTGKVARGAAIGALANGSSGARTGAKIGAGAAVLTRSQAAGVSSGTLLDFQIVSDAKL